MRRFFCHDTPVVGEDALITGQDARHLARVLRLKPGDEVVVLSGGGREYLGKIVHITPDEVKATILSEHLSNADPAIDLTVALGFLKEKKMDDLVRQLTELGMFRFQPFFARRSVSRPDGVRMTSRVRRWEKIARESIKQCRRGSVPEILSAVSLDEVLSRAASDHVKILFWEAQDRKTPFPEARRAASDSPISITILLGPEGGLTEDEVSTARGAGFDICSLGPRILKAETAAVVACTLVQYVYGDMGDFRGQRSEVRGQGEDQKSEVRGQESETRDQK
jgi:16S rRNA (uracil1498-N3)-methyltransferase